MIIGILGGGQLGRMTAEAAATLNIKTIIYTDQKNTCAAAVAHKTFVGSYEDFGLLDQLMAEVDVVTYEFENIPLETAQYIEKKGTLYPRAEVLEISQHRIFEKEFLKGNGFPTADFRAIGSCKDLEAAVAALGTPAILKTARFGYDGKGQWKITDDADLANIWGELAGQPAILESFVNFEQEVSALVARGLDGAMKAFPIVQNIHENHILRTTIAPAPVSEALQAKANTIATDLTTKMGVVGLLAVEMFVTSTGEVLINEIAPRPHNSGHWTMDGCATSQFEQFVRAITGQPLGKTTVLHPTTMINLLGEEINNLEKYHKNPHAHIHDYHKGTPKPGRKMGHINMVEG